MVFVCVYLFFKDTIYCCKSPHPHLFSYPSDLTHTHTLTLYTCFSSPPFFCSLSLSLSDVVLVVYSCVSCLNGSVSSLPPFTPFNHHFHLPLFPLLFTSLFPSLVYRSFNLSPCFLCHLCSFCSMHCHHSINRLISLYPSSHLPPTSHPPTSFFFSSVLSSQSLYPSDSRQCPSYSPT